MKTKGLSLFEAHATGQRYRRAGKAKYWRMGGDDDQISYYPSAILATDYELEPEAKPLTREDVRNAFLRAWKAQSKLTLSESVLDILFGPEDV